MLQNYSRYRILRKFFDFPRRGFQMREISRETKIAQISVMNHLRILAKEKLIIKDKKGIYPVFKANRDSEMFRVLKKNDIILRMHETGLIDFIYDSCLPDVIVLFGSCVNGEDTEESDIDLFVQAEEKKLVLEKFEKLLKRKISIFCKKNFSRLSPELKNNIINGNVVKGYLKVF